MHSDSEGCTVYSCGISQEAHSAPLVAPRAEIPQATRPAPDQFGR
jgi:hypothetical protein